MKIVIITDSHGKKKDIYDIVQKEKPDVVISTGDCGADTLECSYAFPEIKFCMVKGNCDFYDTQFKDNEIVDIGGIKMFMTHGHLYDVKTNLYELESVAEACKVDAVCFGHTHVPYYSEKNGIKYFNPGALRDGKYGVLEIEDTKAIFNFKSIV